MKAPAVGADLNLWICLALAWAACSAPAVIFWLQVRLGVRRILGRRASGSPEAIPVPHGPSDLILLPFAGIGLLLGAVVSRFTREAAMDIVEDVVRRPSNEITPEEAERLRVWARRF